MKKRMISLALSLALCLSLSVPAFAAQSTFTDVPPTFWAYDYIERAAADGAVNGVGNNKFNPNGTLTVAHWMVIMTRAFFGNRVDASTATGTWYAKNKDVADQVDLLNGVSNTNMNSAINRYDMAQIVYNVLSLAGGLVMGVFEDYDVHLVKDRIGDWNKVPQRYQVAVGTVFDKGIIMGTDDKGTFNGSGTFTRAQAAAVYTRMTKFFDMDFVAPDISESEIIEPEDIVTAPVENASPGDTTFAMKNGENVQQMMDRINAATPAYQEGYLTNGKKITDANILEMLEEMKASMPEGTTWSKDLKFNYRSSKLGGGGACNAFAYAMSDAIFGEDAPLTKHQDFENIKIGDVIWEKNTSGSISHVSVVISNPDVNGYFDLASGNYSKEVTWDDESNNVMLANNKNFNKTTYIYSRY